MPQNAETIASTLNARPGLVSSYPFGSFTEDRAHRESEVGIGILLDRRIHPSRAKRFDVRLALIGLIESALAPRRADVVVINDAPLGLAARNMTTGVRTTCSDADVDRAFQRDAQLRAADIEPFLRRMRSIKLVAIRRRAA